MESSEEECERPSTSGETFMDTAILDFAQSKYSLHTTTPVIVEGENDGNATDEEVEICITHLNFLPDHSRRLYMDCPFSLPAGERVAMRGGAETISDSPQDSTSSPEVRYERRRSTSTSIKKYWTLQNRPFECPISSCHMVVSPGILLSHGLMYHEEVISLELKAKEEKCLKIVGKSLQEAKEKSSCLGLMVYESGRQVALNSNLPRIYLDWGGRLPIFVMLWKTSWGSQPVGPRVTHIYILWLLCPQAQPPLMVTVETDKNIPGLPRRQVIHTCSNTETIEKCDLLSDSPLFMRFTHREMKEHTGDYTQDIILHLTICEDETIVPPSSPDPAGNQEDVQSLMEVEQATAMDRLTINEDNPGDDVENPQKPN
ncbi:uncharacterized protein LOC108109671 [Drosophila eugracilis]|uniref:uncharacterized protein LOC108109671 n=1 Tax=Drosophila eugracilis TaxID=29029 RepID=UPI0007E7A601|nr:uncharacterized protein LOC108109671 [Drosophila eugracilis]